LFSKIQSNNEDPRYYMDEINDPSKYDKYDKYDYTLCVKKTSKCKYVGADREKLKTKAIRAARKFDRINDTSYITDLFNHPYENSLTIRWDS
jgi:hypothetical protein